MARWGPTTDKFKVHDEELLGKDPKSVSLGSILAVYRNLRENYEYRLRYDEAGEFFKKEMELKRKYHVDCQGETTKKTSRFRRNFSYTGFYHLASYGESFLMPIALAALTVAASIAFWLFYFHPTYFPSLDYTNGLAPLGNATERSVTTFLQLRNEHLVWEDFIIKAFGF